MKYFFVLIFLISMPLSAAEKLDDWGRTGHRATGEIATTHLSNKAKKAIDALLNGESLALVSTYGDEIKSNDRYGKYWAWHFVNFPFGSRYETHPKSERGDIIRGIDTCVAVLKNENSSKEEKVFHLKMLVHFIGDLHQPLHVGQASDKGGNDFQVRWFDEGTNLHTVWDTKMIESYNMSYSELAANRKRLSKRQILEIQKGTVIDWMYESRALCEDIYANTKVGEKLSYNYMYKYVDVAKFQMQKSGIRLAKMLNDIFG
ncbi:S1/P1 nuclease [Aureitalea sp. L0-47]|uniref:S1/P1 nuclease n=1 Tax=Aureitalea sp. L0-47 TaxID=2816962 RepID=UPI002238397A|nr:S1/P1 nuclease [Aureitalea sp. L0-47]MCW5520258.1 S1/P1 nuclease [Aureitalea sp. L0-47]